ncbi:MAG: hypothetical protein ACTSQI_11075 [Candidatus Helarchaeota archaeon]
MSNFQVFRDKLLTKIDNIRIYFKKMSDEWKYRTEKVRTITKSVDQKITDFLLRLQPENPLLTEVTEDLKTKQMIEGQMAYEDIEQLARTLWENHELAQEKFRQTQDIQYYEMAMEILLVIKEMETLKEYLKKHGK